MKKGQIIYVRYAGDMRRFVVIATDGEQWVAKDWLGITVSSLEPREIIVTNAIKKWWQI